MIIEVNINIAITIDYLYALTLAKAVDALAYKAPVIIVDNAKCRLAAIAQVKAVFYRDFYRITGYRLLVARNQNQEQRSKNKSQNFHGHLYQSLT